MGHYINGLRLAALCVCIGFAVSSSMGKSSPKVIIIGAGASGIASAIHLLGHGFHDITILEAESRIGGRIHTIPFGKNVVDMGAHWCHGEKGNIVYELAYKKGLLEHSDDGEDSNTYVRSNAQLLTRDVSNRLVNITQQIIEDREKEVSQYKGSLGSYMRMKFDAIMAQPENADLDKEIANDFYRHFEKDQCIDEGVDSLDVISARDYMGFEPIEGDYELNWKDKGYKEFLRLLMKTNDTGTEFGVLDGHIKLGKKVNYINWQRNDNKTLVKCEDGEEWLADHVIVTVSLGVLKENYKQMFEPSLPKEKQNAIDALSFGSFGRVFIEFPEKFWADQWDGAVLLWRDEDLSEIRGTNRSWLEDLYVFDTLPYQPFVLEGWIAGAGARHMETLPLEEIKADLMYVLNKFLPPNVPEPLEIAISKWYTNPNFRGCYSYHSLETEKADVDNQHLANPIKNCETDNHVDLCEKPVLQFAGEATHSKHYATVHGAVESGFREAQRINAYYADLHQKVQSSKK